MVERLLSDGGTIVSSRPGGPRLVLELVGEHDLSTAGGLRDALDRALAEGASVVVDLSAVTFVDSSVIGALVSAHRRAAAEGRTVALVAPAAGAAARVLDLLGARSVLAVVESRAQACA